jgi:hypothetical protein
VLGRVRRSLGTTTERPIGPLPASASP